MQNPVEPAGAGGGRVIDSWAYFTLNAGNLRPGPDCAAVAVPLSFARSPDLKRLFISRSIPISAAKQAASLETQTDIALHDFGVDEEHRGPMHATDYETFSFFAQRASREDRIDFSAKKK